MPDGPIGRDASFEEIKKASDALIGHDFSDIGSELSDYEHDKIKGQLGKILERYYGMKADINGEPDFRKAKIELKCKPLKTSWNEFFYPKEPLSIGMINYKEVAETENWRDIKKLREKFLNLMIVWFVHNKDVNKSEFIWWQIGVPTEEFDKEIQEEYEAIRQQILNGIHLSQTKADNDILQTCPKHNYDFNAKEEGSYVKNDGHPEIEKPERRAWRIPTRFLVKMIAESANLKLTEKAGTSYIQEEELRKKAEEKKMSAQPLEEFIR